MSERRSDFPPSITAGKLYERTAASGRTYLAGYFGSMRITVFKTEETSERGDPVWKLCFGEAPSRAPDQGRPTKAEAERPRDPDGDRGRPAMRASSLTVDDEIPF